MKSSEKKIKVVAAGQADDWVAGLGWHGSSSRILVSPASGNTVELTLPQNDIKTFRGYGLNNGTALYAPDGSVCLPGGDGKIRFVKEGVPVGETAVGKGWITSVRWSQNEQFFATASGKSLRVFDSRSKEIAEFSGHKSSVCDFCWNPANPIQIAAVGDGGATMWQIGEVAPFARFDWGGASVFVAWSRDGRWLVTGDLTSSVHLFDFTRNHPLHIQGYETKVRSLSFDRESEKLATAGGPSVVVWDCTGEQGPEGSVPLQLEGHEADCSVVRFHPQSAILATGGQDCRFLLYDLSVSKEPISGATLSAPVTCIEWAPDGKKFAIGCEDGRYHILQLPFS